MDSVCRFFFVLFILLTVLMVSYLLRVQSPKPLVVGSSEAPPPAISAPVEAAAPEQEWCCMKFSLDENKTIGKYHKIRGWAFVEQQDTSGQEIYVQIRASESSVGHFATVPVKRADVAEVFKNPLYHACGFRALIPLPGGAPLDVSKCRLVIKNASGIYTSKVLSAPQ